MDMSNTTVNVVKVECLWRKTIQRVVPKYTKDKPLFLFVTGRDSRMYLREIMIVEFCRGRGTKVLDRAAMKSGIDPIQYIWFPREETIDAIRAIEEISPTFAAWLMFNFNEIM